MVAPVLASHTRTLFPSPADAIRCPSGDQARLYIVGTNFVLPRMLVCACPRYVRMCCPVPALHIWTVPSLPAEAMRLSHPGDEEGASGDHATARTQWEWIS